MPITAPPTAGARRRVVVSTAHGTSPAVIAALQNQRGPVAMTAYSRVPDWGLDWHLVGLRSRLHHVRDALRDVARARGADALVLMHAGATQILVVALVMRLLPLRSTLIVVDFIFPSAMGRTALRSWALDRVAAWGVVRRGDIPILVDGFGVDRSRCHFVPYTASSTEPGEVTAAPPVGIDPEVEFVYSAGAAFRDWALLLEALTIVDCRAVVSIPADQRPDSVASLPDRVSVIDRLHATEGRALAAQAALVVIPLQDTPLPAGPVVLLDAMALGRAVIATDTNGTRDYVRHGDTGWLVPPGDVDALADAIATLLADDDLRARLGAAAARATREEYTPAHYAEAVARLVFDVVR